MCRSSYMVWWFCSYFRITSRGNSFTYHHEVVADIQQMEDNTAIWLMWPPLLLNKVFSCRTSRCALKRNGRTLSCILVPAMQTCTNTTATIQHWKPRKYIYDRSVKRLDLVHDCKTLQKTVVLRNLSCIFPHYKWSHFVDPMELRFGIIPTEHNVSSLKMWNSFVFIHFFHEDEGAHEIPPFTSQR